MIKIFLFFVFFIMEDWMIDSFCFKENFFILSMEMLWWSRFFCSMFFDRMERFILLMMVFLMFWLLLIVIKDFGCSLFEWRMWFKYFFVFEFFFFVIYVWFCKFVIDMFFLLVSGCLFGVVMYNLFFINGWMLSLFFFVCFLINLILVLSIWIVLLIFFVFLIMMFRFSLGYLVWSFVRSGGRIYLLMVKFAVIFSFFLI